MTMQSSASNNIWPAERRHGRLANESEGEERVEGAVSDMVHRFGKNG